MISWGSKRMRPAMKKATNQIIETETCCQCGACLCRLVQDSDVCPSMSVFLMKLIVADDNTSKAECNKTRICLKSQRPVVSSG